MLNLTPDPITLTSPSGEMTTIPVSGYVVRVETTHNPFAHVCFGAVVESREFSLSRHCAHMKSFIPIIEETPKEIVVTENGRAHWNAPLSAHLIEEIDYAESDQRLLLVTREVAEGAAVLKHPLAGRMVWADDRKEHHIRDRHFDIVDTFVEYRTLRRAPRVGP